MTAIDADVLSEVAKPLCIWSGPLLEPPSTYSPASDAVQAWQHVTFGKHDWPLPPVLSRHEDSNVCTAVFAAALLAGKVLPILQGKIRFRAALLILVEVVAYRHLSCCA